MASLYGQNAYRITMDRVNSVAVTGATLLSQTHVDGGYEALFRHDLAGCGSADSGFYIELKDFIPWTRVSVEFWVMGSASCWSFMNSSAYGGAVGASGTGNILNYDESQGDRCIKTFKAQEDPAYSSHNKVYACDNNADNFMRYDTGIYRRCTFVRRRNVNGSLAGVHHGRSCSSTGSSALTLVKNIYVWK